MYNNLNEELFAFIKKSPTSFHAIAAMEEYMENAELKSFPRAAYGT